jgi:hypothetical protein
VGVKCFPVDRAEEARAAALELVPGGFAESEEGNAITLALYVATYRVAEIRAVFADAVVEPLAPGWEDAWRAFHRPVRAGASGSARPGSSRRPASRQS